MTTYDPKKDCCPEFNPAPWDKKTFEWQNKKFIKNSVFTFLHIPLTFGRAMKRLTEQAEKASAQTPDMMALSDHTSAWNMDLYLAVDRDVPEATNTAISGKMVSKVYEGPFGNTGKWCKDFEQYVKQLGHGEIKKWYMWYTTCPKCAKKYGKNYTVIIGQV
ncbi:MAG: hydrolase [Patescibacteria group bacterium]|jgi:hypothetical protein